MQEKSGVLVEVLQSLEDSKYLRKINQIETKLAKISNRVDRILFHERLYFQIPRNSSLQCKLNSWLVLDCLCRFPETKQMKCQMKEQRKQTGAQSPSQFEL